MMEFVDNCLTGTTYPASVLFCIVLVYWILMILGSLDLELFDFDFEFDADADSVSVLSLGLVPVRYLNLGSVPLMLWVSIFSLSWWTIALLLESYLPVGEGREIGLLIARDIGIAVIATKLITNPMRGMFKIKEPHKAEVLIGQSCVMLTGEVTESSGQAEYKTNGAPLKLNVRADSSTLLKGETGEIVDYDPEKNIYFVRKTTNSEI